MGRLFPKKKMFNAGLIMLTLYFIFYGLNNIMNFTERSAALDRKIYNLDVYFNNYYSLSFSDYLPFYKGYNDSNDNEPTPLAKMVTFLYGVATLALGCMMYFFEEKRMRSLAVQLLIILQLFNAFIIRTPFVEERTFESYSRELKHFMLSLSISAGLIMVIGQRVVA